MFAEQETSSTTSRLMDENYEHSAMPEGAEEGILRGLYLLRPVRRGTARVQLFGCGTILREVLAGSGDPRSRLRRLRRCLERDQLQRTAPRRARRRAVEPAAPVRRRGASTWRSTWPGDRGRSSRRPTTFSRSPVRSAPWYRGLPRLGTDGYGRSGYRRDLRRFFEVDRHYVAVAALASLAEDGTIPAVTVAHAISRYDIDPGKPDPSRA